GGGNLTNVQYSLLQVSTGKYWNGSSSFSDTTETLRNLTGAITPNWSLPFPAANFPADGSYTLHMRANDTPNTKQTDVTRTFTIDTTAPTVSGVSSTVADGTYGVGQVVPLTVTFSERLTVTGTPKLALPIG